MFIDKKKLGIIGGIVLAVFFYMLGSGSSNNSTPAPQPTVEDTYTPEVLTDEELYLRDLHSLGDPLVEQNTDSDLITLGYTVCAVYDEGYTTEDIIYELVYNSGLSSDTEFEFAGHIIGVAVKNLCPEYMSELQGYVNS